MYKNYKPTEEEVDSIN